MCELRIPSRAVYSAVWRAVNQSVHGEEQMKNSRCSVELWRRLNSPAHFLSLSLEDPGCTNPDCSKNPWAARSPPYNDAHVCHGRPTGKRETGWTCIAEGVVANSCQKRQRAKFNPSAGKPRCTNESPSNRTRHRGAFAPLFDILAIDYCERLYAYAVQRIKIVIVRCSEFISDVTICEAFRRVI